MLQIASTVISFFAALGIGVFVIYKNRHSHTNILFAIFCFAIAILAATNYLSLHTTDKIAVLFLVRTIMADAIILGLSFMLFIHSFPREKVALEKRYLIPILVISLLGFIIAWSPYLIRNIEFIENGKVYPVVGYGIFVFLINAVGLKIIGFSLLIKRLINEKGKVKKQLQYIFLGSFLMLFSILIFNFYFVIFLKNSSFLEYNPLFVFPFILSTLYALTRYRLFNIKIILKRGVVYIVGLLIVAIFACVLWSIIYQYTYITSIYNLLLVLFLSIIISKTYPRLL